MQIPSFARLRRTGQHKRFEEFGIFGRAFLALQQGYPLIEPMAHLRQARVAAEAGRAVDAYNGYYLFLETQFCRGRTGTDPATNELMKSKKFMAAVEKVLGENCEERFFRESRFWSSAEKWKSEPRRLVREIVELRGHLRHHSLSSPHRWDPNRQHEYDREAAFLGTVAFALAFPQSTGILWEREYGDEFIRQAKAMHQQIEIGVTLTIREEDQLREVYLNFTFPQRTQNAYLAKATLENALKEFDKRSPGAELFALRARVKPNGPELFRYDVGPAIPR